MAITPPIMTYPLGTDYYDVEIFNTNWKNTLTHTDMLFENGVGADVLGYIEDGATHTAGTVWLSKFNKGEFKCLETNTDDFIDADKWEQIDDLTNANKIKKINATQIQTGEISVLMSVGQILDIPVTFPVQFEKTPKVFVSSGIQSVLPSPLWESDTQLTNIFVATTTSCYIRIKCLTQTGNNGINIKWTAIAV